MLGTRRDGCSRWAVPKLERIAFGMRYGIIAQRRCIWTYKIEHFSVGSIPIQEASAIGRWQILPFWPMIALLRRELNKRNTA
jgi:hypothetical protein